MLYIIILTIVGYILFFLGNGSFPLIGDSEGNYAELAREMMEMKDFIVPHLNYVPYLEKPPFFYWLTALTYKVMGCNEAAARLWAAIPALGLVIITYGAGARLKNRLYGFMSALILGTSFGFIMMSKICYMDMLFSCLIGLSLLLFYVGIEKHARKYFYMFYIVLALAVLTKGFAGIILPVLVIIAYICVTRRWRILKNIYLLEGVIIFIVVAAPWHVAAAIKNKEFLWYYFINEHVYRYLGIRYPIDYFHGPIYYHVLRLFAMLFPWSIFIPAGIYYYIKKIGKKENWLFFAVWFLTILIFFSLSKAKANYYMLSALVPVALCIGLVWEAGIVDMARKIERRIVAITFSIYILAGFACLTLLLIYPQIVCDNLSIEVYPASVLMLFFMMLGALLSVFLFFRDKRTTAFIVFLIGVGCAGVVLSQNTFLVNDEKSANEHAYIINTHYNDGDLIVIRGKYERNSTASFYLKKRAYVVCEPWRVDGDLDFGSRYPEHRKYFVNWNEFEQLFNGHKRVFFITKEPGDFDILKNMFPDRTRLMYDSYGRYLITNQKDIYDR
ncbi:MAG: glycosyltransferase family 39 protein [Candidatus Ancaeobacter aquaticus]|nr:glycosyltransferase family 39 protein [Candidatus Ancaeobacter aquaticus]